MNEQSQKPSVGIVDGDNLLFHQSWWNQWPALILFVIGEVVMMYISVVSESVSLSIPVASTSVSVSVLPAFPLIFAVVAAFRVLNERLVVTPDYIIHVAGRVSWSERTVRLEYDHIMEIEIVQTIVQRLLGLGDVIIKPLGGAERSSIRMRGLSKPRAVKDIVRERTRVNGPSATTL